MSGLGGLALGILLAMGSVGVTAGAFAQSGDVRTGDAAKAAPDAAKDAPKDAQQRKVDEFTEAAQAITGPAGNPECVWLGRRVVGLMWRDDIDTAFRHIDLYDRFGCPGGHIQATFRCLVRAGAIDPKAPESLNARVHACWINPNTQSGQSGAAAAPAANAAPAQATSQGPAATPSSGAAGGNAAPAAAKPGAPAAGTK